MSSLPNLNFNFKSFCKVDFSGGDLSANSGLILVAEFMKAMGFDSYLKNNFGKVAKRCSEYSDADLLMQVLYQNIAGYPTDDAADNLAHDPMFKTLLHKHRLASQPTLSRFRHRLDYESQIDMEQFLKYMRRQAYMVKTPINVICDLDTTLLAAYGLQEGAEYNHHYQAVGHHPLLCYDGNTGDLLKAELREGSMYCGNGAAAFIQPLLQEFKEEYPDTKVTVRADSGFAMPDLYECVESFLNADYVIRLKSNSVLQESVKYKAEALMSEYANTQIVPNPIYGEFSYAAKSWDKERRVAYKVELKYSEGAVELIPTCMFIVTNRTDKPEDVIKLYCQRGNMENFIKESKNEFNFESMCSRETLTNENRLLVAAIAYNIFNLFRRLCLPELWKKFRASELRQRLIRIAGRYVTHAKETWFRLCSTYMYQSQFAYTYNQVTYIGQKLEI